MSVYFKKAPSFLALRAGCVLALLSSCAAKPPLETGAFRPADLVELQRLSFEWVKMYPANSSGYLLGLSYRPFPLGFQH